MIDWITAYCPIEAFAEEERGGLLLHNDRIIRFNPRTGENVYETAAWDSIRSDSHSIVCRVTGSAVWVQGSPARCIGDGDSVFSSGASAAEDVYGCAARMVSFLYGQFEVDAKPPVEAWQVTAIDITRNLALDSLAEVRQMLAYLRNTEGGRLRVNQPDGDTVYWNKTSRYKKGKAYAKGPHLTYQMKRRQYDGRPYTYEEINLAERLLRLELRLFRREWEKNLGLKNWQELTPSLLDEQWQSYFGKFIGQTIMNDEELRKRIEAVQVTRKGQSIQISEGQAKAAYTLWYLIKSMGWEMAKENTSRSTWYRNLSILQKAGLKVTDIGNGKIIPFRVQKLVTGQRVSSWAELRQVA